MRTMYDGIDSDASVIPTDAQLVAGYVDGDYAWSQAEWARFPDSVKVRIAVKATTDDGHVLDCETGDATPEEAVNWVLLRRGSGANPTVYCNSSTWPVVKAAFATHDVAQPQYWVASYDGSTAIPAGAVAHQYESTARWDLSSVIDYWPGVDSAPIPTTPGTQEDDMAGSFRDSQQSHNGVALIAFPANSDTTVEFGTDPQFLGKKPTFRASLMMGSGKTPWVLTGNSPVSLDQSGTYVLHIPVELVPFARLICVTCSDPSVEFALYLQ